LLSSCSGAHGILQVFQEGEQGQRWQEATGATCTQGNSSPINSVHTLLNPSEVSTLRYGKVSSNRNSMKEVAVDSLMEAFQVPLNGFPVECNKTVNLNFGLHC